MALELPLFNYIFKEGPEATQPIELGECTAYDGAEWTFAGSYTGNNDFTEPATMPDDYDPTDPDAPQIVT